MAAIDDITALYVAYFNRAPDPEGLNFWLGRNQGIGGPAMSLVEIANSFAVQPEATNLYSFLSAPLLGSSEAFLTAVYLNMFGRVGNATTDPDDPATPGLEGFPYWQAQLALPGGIGRVLQDIRFGATGNDLLVINNKTAVGKAFVQRLVDTNTDFNLALAQSALSGVTETQASVDAKIIANNAAITGAGGSGGTTFDLKAGTDTLVGGSGDDVFNGIADASFGSGQTFTSVDNLDGGGGLNDVLNLLIEGTAVFPNGPINNIEIFNVRNLAGALTINAGAINGETAFNFDRGTGATTVVNLATGTTVGIIGDGLTVNGASTFAFAVPTSPVTLNISGGTLGAGAVSLAGAGSAIINSTGATNTIGALTLGAAASTLTINATTALLTGGLAGGGALKTITVSGAAANVPITATSLSTGAVTLGTVGASVTTIDASGLTAGGIRVGLGAGVTSFKGGAGNDVVNTAALNGSAVIDAGANTPLSATSLGDAVLVLATTDVDTAAEALQYKGFEVLSAIGGVTVKVSDFTNSTISTLGVFGDNIVFNAVSQAQAASVLVGASAGTNVTFNVTGAGVSGTDVLNLGINDLTTGAPATITLGNITAPGVETINAGLTDNLTITLLTGATGLTTMGFSGTGNLSLTTGALALTSNSTTINASALAGVPGGTVLIDAGLATGFGITITGSSTYANTLTGTNLADTLLGGTGNDFLNNQASFAVGGSTATAADLLTGGAGQDTFTLFGTVASGAIPAVYNTAARVSDFGVTTGTATTDILALSATFGNYAGISALSGTVAAAAAGATVVQSLAQSVDAAFTAGLDLVKLSTGVVTTGLTTQTAFNTAIGTGSVTGLTAGFDIFASFYDTTNSRAVILAVETFNGVDGDLESGDVVNLIGTINMSAADYATFGTAQLAIVA